MLNEPWVARLAELQKLLTVCPTDLLARCDLALLLERLDQYEEAHFNWKAVLDTDPNNLKAREGMSRWQSFLYGQASGMVEPIAGVIGAAAVLLMRPILPYALSFAAGAMIFVVVEELIPESQLHGNTDLATLGTMLGFAVMMTLDVALG